MYSKTDDIDEFIFEKWTLALNDTFVTLVAVILHLSKFKYR